MNTKLIVFIALFALSHCWEVLPAEELNLKFLAAEDEEKGKLFSKLNCADDYPFLNTRAKINPTTVVKGDTISLKVVGQSSKPISIRNMVVSADMNGTQAFEEKQDINKDIDAGSNFVYQYKVNVPTFIPEGKFNILIKLQDNSGADVSCFNAWFGY